MNIPPPAAPPQTAAAAAKPPVTGADLRDIRRALQGAGDDQVLQVLNVVDTLQNRGQADGLVAPYRQRLRQLRPPRPQRLPRLLFAPLNPAVVDAADWRPGSGRIARSMIAPLCAIVRRALPQETAAAEAVGLDIDRTAADRVHDAGRSLWPAAAVVLALAEEPPEWRANAVPSSVFAPMAAAVAHCLGAAHRLNGLADPAMPAVEREAALQDVLRAALQTSPLAWAIELTIMLQLLPFADTPHNACQRTEPALRAAVESAKQAAWAWIETAADDVQRADPAEAASELNRQVSFLDRMAAVPACHRQAVAHQSRLRDKSAVALQAALANRVLQPLQDLPAGALASDAAWNALESEVRGVRRLEMAARRLGGSATQNAHLREVTAAIAARADLSTMDRKRLLETLLGPQSGQPQ